MKRRKIEILVLSDIHLGTYGCKASELLQYLKTVKPETLILNGDIIDGWHFSRHYFPKSHLKVIKHFLSLLSKGCKIYYIPGNHDEMMRRFKGFHLGSLQIVNQLRINRDGKSFWFFHGDVFDMVMNYSKWLAKVGGISYDFLIVLNAFLNKFSQFIGVGKISLSMKVKNGVKGALKFINDFEESTAAMSISRSYDFVVCGHIHQPEIRKIDTKGGSVMYLNSGDWIENMSALEYNKQEWKIYRYQEDLVAQNVNKNDIMKNEKKNKQIFQELLKEFQLIRG
jgi:UDP-2,3-diacylglucosamine pyrophosphatase LpxH